MTSPDLSVIVVTYRSRRHIAGCLASVEKAVAGIAAEIVVVDNASGDGTVEVVRDQFPQVRLIALPTNVGFGAAINQGLAGATGRYILWLNPDSRVIAGHVTEVIAWMDARPDVGIVGCQVLDPGGALQRSARAFPSYGSALGHRYSFLTRRFPRNPFSRRYLGAETPSNAPGPVDWVSGAALLHRRAVSDALGGLDERFFMYCEDVDFCYRASRGGWKVFLHPGLVIEHEIGGSSRQVSRPMVVARHRSIWLYYAKHFRRFWLKDAIVWTWIRLRCVWLWLRAGDQA